MNEADLSSAGSLNSGSNLYWNPPQPEVLFRPIGPDNKEPDHQPRKSKYINDEQWFDIQIDPARAEEIVDTIIRENFRGKLEDFLKMIDLLSALKKPWLSRRLCEYAVTIGKINGDLYAAAIEAITDLGEEEELAKVIEDFIDSKYEKFPAYRFGKAICYFFYRVANASAPQEKRKYVQKGLDYANKLKSQDPRREFGYYWEVKLLKLVDPVAAEDKLSSYVRWGRPQEFSAHSMDTEERLMCPRCCRLLIEEYLSLKGPTASDEIKEVAQEGFDVSDWLLATGNLTDAEMIELRKLKSYFKKIKHIKDNERRERELRRKVQRATPRIFPESNITEFDKKRFKQEDYDG